MEIYSNQNGSVKRRGVLRVKLTWVEIQHHKYNNSDKICSWNWKNLLPQFSLTLLCFQWPCFYLVMFQGQRLNGTCHPHSANKLKHCATHVWFTFFTDSLVLFMQLQKYTYKNMSLLGSYIVLFCKSQHQSTGVQLDVNVHLRILIGKIMN